MCVTENRAASLHPLVVSFTFVHVKPPMKPEYLFCKKSQNFIAKALRIFQHRNVGSIQFEVTGAGNLIGEKATIGGRSGGRASGGKYQQREAEFGGRNLRVEIPGRAATRAVCPQDELTRGTDRIRRHREGEQC